MRRTLPLWIALAASLAAFSGCGSDRATAPVPGIQPQIVNNTDDFAYQVSAVQTYTGTASYSWQNTGTQADVNQATTVGGGAMTLVILDANGTEVYSRSLADNGTFQTAVGVAGAWTVRIQYAAASGTVNFRAQKKT